MPDEQTLERARQDEAEGKSASTQAGDFVREEMHHIREGQHGARSTEQAIAIGLSKARRTGVKLGSPKRGAPASPRRASAVRRALKREGHQAASAGSLARHARASARSLGARRRSAAARKAARTRARSSR